MQIIMPKLGLTMTHGTITEWLKAPGDAVKAEEALCAYETEKVTLELSAPEDGVLAEILAPAGSTVPAGAAVCVFVTGDEGRRTKDGGQGIGVRSQAAGDGSQAVAGDPQLLVSTPAERAVQLPASGPLNATPKARTLARELGVDLTGIAGSGPDGRVQARDVEVAHAAVQPAPIKATPLARRIAAAGGIDLRSIAGTGPEGTITREDVEQAVRDQASGDRGQETGVRGQESAAAPVSQAVQLPATSFQLPASSFRPHSALRRTIAERMSQSAFNAPHVTLMTEAEATNLVSARAQLNAEVPAADKISYNTLLAALAARALREHPNVNARWEADGIRLLAEINIALAVDTERGLMTPVLREVDRLSLSAVQRGYAALLDRALAGRSLPDDFADGTFTITNLGGLDVDGFTPLINPPQAAILGVGRIVEKPVARDGAVVIRPMMTLSLSFDHRIVDGAPAAKFLQRVKQLVERPMALLLRDA
jgi:pyruvate dehydrogenase E2 component (dihydrolipoamide acetyltransferase)